MRGSRPALVARPVGEKVAQVAVAVLGADLGPCHAVRAVHVFDDVRGLERPLGQPVPLSNLSNDTKSGSAETTST